MVPYQIIHTYNMLPIQARFSSHVACISSQIRPSCCISCKKYSEVLRYLSPSCGLHCIAETQMRVKGKRNDEGGGGGGGARHIFLLCALSFVVVVLIKSFGAGSWHSKAANHEEHNVNISAGSFTKDSQVKSSLHVTTDNNNENVRDRDSNFVEFVFSNLEGKSQQEGSVFVELVPEWAPLGVKRIKELTATSFWDNCRVFRVIHNFMAQLGINGDPQVQKLWVGKPIRDDPVKTSNARGTVTFAMAGPNTRTSQIFFNKVDNKYLDGQGFAPFGKVVSGMDVVDRINEEYVEKPNQGKIQNRGNAYLLQEFPRLSFIKSARFVESTDVK